MKTIKKTFVLALLGCFLLSTHAIAQDDKRPEFVVFSTMHWNLDLTSADSTSDERWSELRKDYHEKVDSKNEHLKSSSVISHLYSADNSEVIHISTYKDWESIELAQNREEELIDSAWVDEDERKAFFDEWDQYYTGVHSDEIYRTIAGAKIPTDTSKPTAPRVVYMQKQQLSMSHDGNSEEFDQVRMEYAQKVIHNLPGLIAYYPLKHGWGSDNRDMVDIFILASLADVGAMNQSYGEVIEAAWPDEAERKAFFKKYDKYYTGQHGDYLYRTIPMD